MWSNRQRYNALTTLFKVGGPRAFETILDHENCKIDAMIYLNYFIAKEIPPWNSPFVLYKNVNNRLMSRDVCTGV